MTDDPSVANNTARRIVTPVPDPTSLSTAQVIREVGNLREVLETRLNAMDKALELLQRRADRVPSETDIAISQLKMLHEEKFRSVYSQIHELADRAKSASADSKEAITTALKAAEKAVEAALQAAKDAVSEQNKAFSAATAKNETSTGRQLESITTMINATVSSLNDKIDAIGPVINAKFVGLDDKIDDLKSRLLTIEGSGKGSKDLMAIIFTIAGISIAAIAAFIAFSRSG